MKVIIAEKPSVAREIASIVGATNKQEGYIEGAGYAVTWALGHLISLAMPEEYGVASFSKASLPILPSPFKLIIRQNKVGKTYKTDGGAKKQLDIIKALFDRADSIIVATDAGREGELIFRYIYNYLKCDKPFERLWINSLTDKAIRDGISKLKQGSEYDNLYLAAKGRSEADWLIGINATQALSISAGYGVYSLGRVQTPTLMMICNRYLENKNFTSCKYWQIKIDSVKDGVNFSAISNDKYDSLQEAQSVLASIKDSGNLRVQKYETKAVQQEPPLLYDLTSLQKDANSKLGFSADKTLSLAQSLYEKKVLSYPRTGSRYIPDDVFEEMGGLISTLKEVSIFESIAEELCLSPLNKRSVNAAKVTDHHALIITENRPHGLSKEEEAIYNLVASRLLESFSKPCIKELSELVLSANDNLFTAKGQLIKQAGWREVRQEVEEDIASLPSFIENQDLPLVEATTLEKQTKPKALHTESSLLTLMETAGKELENEDERTALKELGIGTPATRASIIETLFARDYIRRDKKSLVPTEKGLNVFKVVKDKKIADVQMTGMWENNLNMIEQGRMDADTFKDAISNYASQITEELLNTKIENGQGQSSCACPKCGTENMLFFDKVVKCRNVDCGVTIFRERSGKQLSDKQITELLEKGKTSIIKGFKSKAGKSFDAALSFDEEYKVNFIFPEKK